jgi:hypothetical protein
MASTISAGTTTTTALSYSADTSGVLQLQTNGGTTALTLDTSQNATFAGKVASASSLQLATNGTTTAVTIDTNQNVGVGVTPSAYSTGKVVEVGYAGNAFWGYSANTNLITQNTNYVAGVLKYSSTNPASYYQQSASIHSWGIAPSGTAGNAITFTQAMTLDGSNNLLVGTTTVQNPNVPGVTVKTSQQGFIIYDGVDSSYNEFGVWDGSTNQCKAVVKNEGGIGKFGTRTNSQAGLQTNDTVRVYLSATGLFPVADNTYTIGQSGNRWSAVWSANGTIQTSDEREKTNITPSDLGLDFILKLQPVSYKWKHGGNEIVVSDENVVDGGGSKVETAVSKEGRRTHYGFIAQQVKQTVGDKDFGGWILTNANDPESQQALRYDQFISPLVKAIQELSAQVTTLQTQVTALKG